MKALIIGFCVGSIASGVWYAIKFLRKEDYVEAKLMGGWALLNLVGLIVCLVYMKEN